MVELKKIQGKTTGHNALRNIMPHGMRDHPPADSGLARTGFHDLQNRVRSKPAAHGPVGKRDEDRVALPELDPFLGGKDGHVVVDRALDLAPERDLFVVTSGLSNLLQ